MENNQGCRIGKVIPKLHVIRERQEEPNCKALLREAFESWDDEVTGVGLVLIKEGKMFHDYAGEQGWDYTSLLGGLDTLKTKVIVEQYLSQS